MPDGYPSTETYGALGAVIVPVRAGRRVRKVVRSRDEPLVTRGVLEDVYAAMLARGYNCDGDDA